MGIETDRNEHILLKRLAQVLTADQMLFPGGAGGISKGAMLRGAFGS